ncbi:RbsD/FucU family protein [Sporosarcina sp. NPDC096371]|uniref:RbsD/FucU family protein n=1 Tax=Sporosarcina sp. NPDC096371 TaxID=3364530 RepID=UPI0037F338C7
MLKHISKNLSPELLKILMEMGHGDEIVLADGNFPSASHANNLIRLDGQMMPAVLESILTLFPLDTYVESPVTYMATPQEEASPAIWESYATILSETGNERVTIQQVDRFEFYNRAQQAYAIVATSETALYANIILKKGVI